MQNVADIIPTEWAALPYLAINYIYRMSRQWHLSGVSRAVSGHWTEVEMEIGLIKVGYIIC